MTDIVERLRRPRRWLVEEDQQLMAEAATEIETLRATVASFIRLRGKLPNDQLLEEIGNVLYRYRNEDRTDAVNDATAKEIVAVLTQMGLT